MSIIDSFDDKSEELLKATDLPVHAGKIQELGEFPETVIVTFSRKAVDLARNKFGAREISFMLTGEKIPVYEMDLPEEFGQWPDMTGSRSHDSERWMEPADSQSHRKLAIYQSGMGAPLAVALLEEVIAKGGRKFIVFGSCGALLQNLAEGRLIVPDEAYRDEGTSYHYAPAADYITVKNADLVSKVLSEIEVPHVEGRIWTTDGLYRETKNNADARRAEGCIAVDMECSALQAACNMRNVELYQYVYAEDMLSDSDWMPRNMGLVTHDEMEGHLRVAMEIAARI
ncbi:MAG: nucleoside phosphorylase [Clostridiales bacterium]|nr:nucleoside phosphorylase [Clostridiales bacterium]